MSDQKKFQQAIKEAALLIMELSESAGVPFVATNMDHDEDHHQVIVSFSGTAERVDEVLRLMQRKYPNAGVHTVSEFRDQHKAVEEA